MNRSSADPRRPLLIVITGPTGSGKSQLALQVAARLGCDIISADSRQIYRHIPVTTAVPSAEERRAVRHHFVETLELDEYYSAAQFEADVMELLPQLWATSDYAVMCGGSMMYVDAVCNGIDLIPTVSPQVREEAYGIFRSGGIEAVRSRLLELDPDYYAVADLNNHKRLIHAIEVSVQAGVPFSSLLTGRRKERPFDVLKVAIDLPRDVLFDRINHRVDQMVQRGMIDEARAVIPLRNLNSLNTVGFKELFAAFDGTMPLHVAIERIKKNTRVYAKKQLTWLKRDPDIRFLPASTAFEALMGLIHVN